MRRLSRRHSSTVVDQGTSYGTGSGPAVCEEAGFLRTDTGGQKIVRCCRQRRRSENDHGDPRSKPAGPLHLPSIPCADHQSTRPQLPATQGYGVPRPAFASPRARVRYSSTRTSSTPLRLSESEGSEGSELPPTTIDGAYSFARRGPTTTTSRKRPTDRECRLTSGPCGRRSPGRESRLPSAPQWAANAAQRPRARRVWRVGLFDVVVRRNAFLRSRWRLLSRSDRDLVMSMQ